MKCLKILSALALSFLLSAKTLAFEWEASVDVLAGYRSDKITCLIDSYDPPDNLIGRDFLKAKYINVWEAGLKGDFTICNNWFVKGFAIFGKVTDGNYREDLENSFDDEADIKAHIYKGNTFDGSIGVGYLHPFCDECFWVGPSVGWAYDHHSFRIRDAFFEDVPDPVLEGLTYKNRWQGPWLGLETWFCVYCFDVGLGYEYHWAHWNAEWILDGEDVEFGAFSDHRKSKHAYGNLFFFDIDYSFCCFWNVGIEFKYQYWKATSGREHPAVGSFADIGFPNEVDKVPQATWKSYEFQLYLGYTF